MVWGVIGLGIGAVLAGAGIFKGSSKIGKAAESVAGQTDRALHSISKNLNELKTYLVKEIGPNVNETLLRF